MIALCEAAMIPLTLLQWPDFFRGRSVTWYVDNTSAMHSFVRGASADPHLERLVGAAWILAFHLRCQIWFEWVDSESNWSDNLSRCLDQCAFTRSLGFHPQRMELIFFEWDLEWELLWHTMERFTVEGAP